jgi:DNA-binding PucR family transcriptional regulator
MAPWSRGAVTRPSAVLIGISADHPSTAFIPKALNDAAIAFDFAQPAKRVISFRDVPFRRLLVRHGTNHLQSVTPAWASVLVDADSKANGSHVQTLRAIADADLNIQKAARSLGKHPNTVYARIARIRELTGLDAQRYHDLTDLILAADCWRV